MAKLNSKYCAHCLLLFVSVMVSVLLSAQATTKAINHKLSEKTVVKDSSGKIYAYQDWQQMLMSGDFTIVPEEPESEETGFLLKKLSEEEKEQRFAAMPKPKESESFKTDSKFVPFAETDINGNKIRLKELKGKVVVLNFWFINCPPCRIEIPHLNALVKTYESTENVVFIAIGLDAKKQIAEFLKSFPFGYIIIDNGRNLADRYGIRSYPTHVVIDREGTIKFHTSGLAINTIYWLKKSIEEALKSPVGLDTNAKKAN